MNPKVLVDRSHVVLKPVLRAAAVLALVAAVAAPAAASPPAPPSTSEVSLRGTARLGYPVAEEEVRVTVDAHAAFGAGSFPTRSWGTFRISHVVDGRDHWGVFEVDCLTSGGPTATVTGRLVRTSPGHVWRKELEPHTRMGLGFYVPGGGTARVGLSGATAEGEPLLTRCMAPAADMEVVDGGYSLRGAR
ncbi:hypothetical protein [Streptomyces griseomycini]|uniref:hypothetical protein n=1 Tax=Streptomyces griseomycini TaxID=66895 RepID=UPI001676193E|nr:hypothetical protein [Streptomyces griseomycini]GGR10432.1 hypothetical protein GCM10015536_14490 [Streptomyces griseomycini]